MAERTSSKVGKRPVAAFENTSLPLMETSKRPPPEGWSANSLTFVLYSPRSFSAKLTALGK